MTPAPTNHPAMPYTVKMLAYGTGLERATKIYDSGLGGELLSDDEIAVWAYVQLLEAECRRLKLAAELAPLNTAIIPLAVAATLSDLSNRGPATSTNLNTLDAPELLTSANIPSTDPAESAPSSSAPETGNPASNSQTLEGLEAASGPTKRERAERALLEVPHLNNCLLAEQVGCSDEYIRLTRKRLESEGKLQRLESVARRDGTTYTTAPNVSTTGAGNLAATDGEAAPGAG